MSIALTLPWLGFMAFVLLRVRLPGALPDRGVDSQRAPLVSVIVPARDEAANVEGCLRSLAASTYPRFEVIVVDDQSRDGTAGIARGVPPGHARRIDVLEGTDVPDGWLGKPWACHQGAARSRGDLLLFTDADTIHGARLLERAVAELERDRAGLLTVAGRQLMGSFWERLVQPQVFLTLLLRYWDVERWVERGRWRDAIANGQFLLFRRETYEAVGGHEAVRDEVVEDLVMGQLVARAGERLTLRTAEDDLATRMYRSLGDMVRGWSKNLAMGGLRTVPPALRPFTVPAAILFIVGMWIVPPALLLLRMAGLAGGSLLGWAAVVTVASASFWAAYTRRMGAPAWYGLLYPVGAAVHAYLFLRSGVGGRRVRWKGRSYVLRPLSGCP